MFLGHVFNSNDAWGKLTVIAMEPSTAYKILKYIRLVNAEYSIIEKQRVALLHKITDIKDGENVQIKPGTSEHIEYFKRFNEILSVECTLEKFDVSLEEVLQSITENSTLTVQDLATLEPFFVE